LIEQDSYYDPNPKGVFTFDEDRENKYVLIKEKRVTEWQVEWLLEKNEPREMSEEKPM
jgi:hypothetical protein